MAGVRINGVDSGMDLHVAGDVGMTNIPALPTNGALMSDEQYDDLRVYVTLVGSPLEKAMLCQMKAMLAGVKAWKNSRDVEWNMRMEVETELAEARRQLRMVRGILSVPTSKLNKPDLLNMVKKALAELPPEPVEVSE